eukprot:4036280-Prymnesium_polylepis.1
MDPMRSAAMEAEVRAAELRLQDLKTAMGKDKEQRDAQRKNNPGGAVWKSARSDAPTGKRYVHSVLTKKQEADTRPIVPLVAPPGHTP